MDTFPRAPKAVVIEIAQPVADAEMRLGRLLSGRPSIEPRTNGSSNRRLIGHLEGADVRLSVWDANDFTRRKSWNVEFNGALEPTPSGAILRGAVDIPDRAQLRTLMWMFRVASAFVPLLVLGLNIRGLWDRRPLDPAPAIGAVALAVIAFLVVGRLEADGERRARDDARLLVAGVGRLLRE